MKSYYIVEVAGMESPVLLVIDGTVSDPSVDYDNHEEYVADKLDVWIKDILTIKQLTPIPGEDINNPRLLSLEKKGI